MLTIFIFLTAGKVSLGGTKDYPRFERGQGFTTFGNKFNHFPWFAVHSSVKIKFAVNTQHNVYIFIAAKCSLEPKLKIFCFQMSFLILQLFCQSSLKYKWNFWAAETLFDFLFLKILKLCTVYLIFKKLIRKNRCKSFSACYFPLWGFTLCAYLTP